MESLLFKLLGPGIQSQKFTTSVAISTTRLKIPFPPLHVSSFFVLTLQFLIATNLYSQLPCPEITSSGISPGTGTFCPGDEITLTWEGINLENTIACGFGWGIWSEINPNNDAWPLGCNAYQIDEGPCVSPLLLYAMVNPDDNLVGSTDDCHDEFFIVYIGGSNPNDCGGAPYGVYIHDLQLCFNYHLIGHYCPGNNTQLDFTFGNASTFNCGTSIGPDDFIPTNSILVIQTSPFNTIPVNLGEICNLGLPVFIVALNTPANCTGGFMPNSTAECNSCALMFWPDWCHEAQSYGYILLNYDLPSTPINGWGVSNAIGGGVYGNFVPDINPPAVYFYLEVTPLPCTYVIPTDFCLYHDPGTYYIQGGFDSAWGFICPNSETTTQIFEVNIACLQVFAGPDLTICEGDVAMLQGDDYGNSGTYEWTTNGDGEFVDPSSLQTNYTPGPNDILNGSVVLTLSLNIPNGSCSSVSDELVLTINGINPVLNLPDVICQYDPPILLPTIQGGYPGNWSGISVNNNVFDPSGLDGNYALTFSPGQNQCANSVTVWISVLAFSVSFDLPQSICETDPPLYLDPTQSGIPGYWSGIGVSNNIFNPSGLSGYIALTFNPDPVACAVPTEGQIFVGDGMISGVSGVPASVCENNNPVSLPTVQDGVPGNWSGPGVNNNNFNPSGLNGIYILTFTPNSGQCAFPVTADIIVEPVIIISITGIPGSLCQINPPIPLSTIQSGITGNWSGPGVSNNTFDPAGLNGNIILTFTPNAGICALPENTSISVFQNFYTISGIPQSVCVTDPSVQLPLVQNGITGNWSGLGVANNSFNPSGQNGIVALTFTPDAGQCAATQSQTVFVNPLVIPPITGIPNSICENSLPITLLTIQNNINGSWSGQGVTSNTFNPDGLSGNIILTFTPGAGQCALSNTTTIQVITPIIPIISDVPVSLCEGDLIQDLATTQNGINGNWSGPGVFNNTFNPVGQSGTITLIFTPEVGQCALTNEWNISVETAVIPIISGLPSTICQTDLPISLSTIQNGYPGMWSGPGVISNTFNPNGLSGPITLFFNPDNGQCVASADVEINVEPAIIPSLSGIPILLCETDGSFNPSSIQDGITGTWSGPGVANNVFNPIGHNGTITLSFIPELDQCAAVATIVISVSPSIVPIITAIPTSLCQSDSPLVLSQLQDGIIGNWSGQNVTSNIFVPGGLEGNYILNFTPLSGQCAISSTAQISVNASPHFINLHTACDTISQTYHVAFDIIGGDPAGYTINGSPITGSAFISSPLSADSTHYSFTLDDGNGCGPVFIEGSVNCACTTYAGTMNFQGAPLKICEGTGVTVPFNGDTKLDVDDLSAFILHDNAGTLLGTIYAISNNTTFSFPSGIVLGQVYFISPVAGSNNGQGSIELNDPCLSVSQGIPVIFYRPQATISNGGIICADDCMAYTFQLSGEKPFELAYKVVANGMQTDQLLVTDTNIVNVNICPQDFGITEGVIGILPISLKDANCTIDLTPFTGSQTIVRPASTAFISETLCRGESLTMNGTVYDQFNSSGTQLLQNAEGCDSTIHIQLTFLEPSTFELNQTLCFGGSLNVNGTVYNESHPNGTEILPDETVNGCDSIIEVHLEFDSVVISNFYTTLCSGESIEINGNVYDEFHPTGTELFPNGSVLGCDSLVNIKLTYYPVVSSDLNNELCKGEVIIVNGNVYDENHPAGIEVIKKGSVFGCDSVIRVTLTFMSEAYEFITDTLDAGEFVVANGTVYDQSHSKGIEIIFGGSVDGCDSTIEILLYFRKALSVLTEAITPVCPGESTGEIVVKEITGGASPYKVSIDGGSQMTITVFPVILSGLNSGHHQVIFTDAASNQMMVEVEVPEPPALEVDAGMDLSIKHGGDASLTAKASFPVSTWLWAPDDFLSCVDCPDPLIEKPDHDVIYIINVTDQNGCQASDEVALALQYEDGIYAPTVFSPNGDGVNDTWRIYSDDHQAQMISLSIMDRWGGNIFSRSNLLLGDTNAEWDGTYKGKEMMPGVFVFVAVVVNGDGKRTELKGDITLLQ